METINEQELYILITIGIIVMLTFACIIILMVARAQKSRYLERLEANKQLMQGTILAEEKERRRIAKDLHDAIGAKLGAIALQLENTEKTIEDPLALKKDISFLSEIVELTIDETRRISHNLLPPTLNELGLKEALLELKVIYTNTKQVNIDIEATDFNREWLEKEEELHLFRVVQELIKNSISHGKAKQIKIDLSSDASHKIKLKYKDDGKGFDRKKLTKNRGLGMKNIENRLSIIQATWLFESAPQQGFQLEVSLKK